MRVLITGATGFLGRALSRELLVRGHDLVILSRDAQRAERDFPFPARFEGWDSLESPLPGEALEGVSAIVHLAGEPVAAKRWNREQKKKILDSRVLGTRHLWQGIARARAQGRASGLKAVVAGSAIGFYGNRGEDAVNEASKPGEGFLADTCVLWEREIFTPGFDEIRQVAVRTGIVLGLESGALAKLLPLFRWGVGGVVGNGKQVMSWIHLEDIVRVFADAIEDDSYRGIVNGVAPGPVTNFEFSKTLAHVLGRPAVVPSPAIGLRLALGEMAHLVLDGQRVMPDRLLRAGFKFNFSTLEPALRDLCAPEGVAADQQFVTDQWVPRPVEELFPFFSEAKNLAELTPPWIGFEIKKVSDRNLQEGTLIDYRLKIHGFPVRWRTRIEQWQPNRTFVDTQLKGPYAKWHHHHTFTPARGGTLMRDRVLYRLPLGVLGKKMAHWKVRQDIEGIFAYRRKRISEIFK